MIDDKFIHIHPNVGFFSRNRPWWNPIGGILAKKYLILKEFNFELENNHYYNDEGS